MLPSPISGELRRAAALGRSLSAEPAAGPGTFRVTDGARRLFVKIRPAARFAELEAEADGLGALARAGAIAVPAVHACGVAGEHAFLAVDWLDLRPGTERSERLLGAALARQHRTTAAAFGYTRDNFIGPTPQPNPERRDWAEFFRDARLGPQLELAAANGLPADCVERGRRLLAGLDRLLGDHRPEPSLLHGDLWGGNWGTGPDGAPYVFDPAVYFGDREADLAMTRLFGGFGPSFYRAYRDEWPLRDGADRRVDLYNLYHLLNHFNLFGASYLGAVRAALERCLELGAARQASSR